VAGAKGAGGAVGTHAAIAIDGPGGVGKTTVSKRVAELLGFAYVDTGAMYRAAAVAADDAGIAPDDAEAIARFASTLDAGFESGTGRVTINGADYTGRIRGEEAGSLASTYSALAPVREALTTAMRAIASTGPVVMEGRDIGTVVLPGAGLKVFLDADPAVRAERRHAELGGADVETVGKKIEERDLRDSTRAAAPLKRADDAVVVDTTGLAIDEVVERIMELARSRGITGDAG